MEQLDNNILLKIKALFDKAESAKQMGSLEEAESFATKAQELLMKYNLEMSDVRDAASADKKEAMVKGDIKFEELTGRHESDWVLDLYNVIARHNLCAVVISRRRDATGSYRYLSLIGYKSNAEIVDYTVKQLVTRIRAMSRSAFSQYFGDTKRNTWVRGYLRGAVNGINIKLTGAVKELTQANPGVGLMIISNEVQLKETMTKLYGKLGKSSQTRLKGQDGFEKGQQDGKNMSIHKGLDGKGGSNPILGNKNNLLN